MFKALSASVVINNGFVRAGTYSAVLKLDLRKGSLITHATEYESVSCLNVNACLSVILANKEIIFPAVFRPAKLSSINSNYKNTLTEFCHDKLKKSLTSDLFC